MPRYTEDLIEEVRSRNDIVDVISQYVHLKKKGSNYFGLCPFHNEKTGSFSVSPNKQMYYCFGCGAGGNVFTFVMNYENFTFSEAMGVLADRAGMTLPTRELTSDEKRQRAEKERLFEIQKEAAKYFYVLLHGKKGEHAYQYFKERGLTDETINKFGLGYSDKYSDDLYKHLRSLGYEDAILKKTGLVGFSEKYGGQDKFWNRAMFPIMDMNQKVIAFGGRVLGEGEPKYLNSQETDIFKKKYNLYGQWLAKTTKRSYLLLCEGYMDVIALHQAGFDNAVAALGTAFTAEHVTVLNRKFKGKDIYLTFDSDGAGIGAALRAIPILREAEFQTKVVNMSPYKDPDEFIKALGAEEYEKRIEQAENSFLFEVRIAQKDYDMNDPASKTAFQSEIALMLLDAFSDEMERDNYLEAVCDKFNLSFEKMREHLVKVASKTGLVRAVSPKPKLKSGINEANKKEDGMKRSQKLLLTWMIEDQRIYPMIKPYIKPDDFTEGLYKRIAEILFDQFESGSVNAAGIISMTEDEEEQKEIASLFNAQIAELETEADREKALHETVVRIKDNSLQMHKEQMDVTDLAGMQKMVEAKKNLEKLQKLSFKFE